MYFLLLLYLSHATFWGEINRGKKHLSDQWGVVARLLERLFEFLCYRFGGGGVSEGDNLGCVLAAVQSLRVHMCVYVGALTTYTLSHTNTRTVCLRLTVLPLSRTCQINPPAGSENLAAVGARFREQGSAAAFHCDNCCFGETCPAQNNKVFCSKKVK